MMGGYIRIMNALIVQTKKDITLFIVESNKKCPNLSVSKWLSESGVGAGSGFKEKRFAGMH
jgi:hypothetical protein